MRNIAKTISLGLLVVAASTVSACRLGTNNAEKLEALKAGLPYDENGVIASPSPSPTPDTTAPSVSLSNLDPYVKAGGTMNFEYALSDDESGVASAKLDFSADGTNFTEIGDLSASATSHDFSIPSSTVSSQNAKLRIRAKDQSGNEIEKTSGPFTVLTTIETFAGTPYAGGSADGVGTQSRFNAIVGMAKIGDILYVAETTTVRKVDLTDPANPVVTLLAGHPIWTGSVASTATGGEARFTALAGMATDGTSLYVSDTTADVIYKINPTTREVSLYAGVRNSAGTTDNTTKDLAQFKDPRGLLFVGTDLLVADYTNHVIRKIDAAGNVTTIAGAMGTASSTNGAGTAARFSNPMFMAAEYDSANSKYWVYIVDRANYRVRKMDYSDMSVTTLAGSVIGYGNGTGTGASFSLLSQLVVVGDYVYVADSTSATIRKIHKTSQVVTTLAGLPWKTGEADGTPAQAKFRSPYSMVTDGTSLYVGETINGSLRKVDIGTGNVSTIAGSSGLYAQTVANEARMSNGIRAMFAEGTDIYITDTYLNSVRKFDTASGQITTIAGGNGPGATNSTPLASSFSSPYGIVKIANALYVADTTNQVIRKIDLGSNTVTTFSGIVGTAGSTDTSGGTPRFNGPRSLAVSGNVIYVANLGAHNIRKIDLGNNNVVTTVAGTANTQGYRDTADGAPLFRSPNALLVVGSNLYVGDSGNNVIRKIDLGTNTVTTLAGNGTAGYADGTGTAAQFNSPGSMVLDSSGDYIYVADNGNFYVRKVRITAPNVGEVTTLVGSGIGGYRDGTGKVAYFNSVFAMVGVGNLLYLADYGNYLIRTVDPATKSVGTAMGTYNVAGDADGAALDPKPMLSQIVKVGSDFYATDKKNSVIWKLNAAGTATLFAGSFRSSGVADGALLTARFAGPRGICAVGNNLYIGEYGGSSIRKINLDTNQVSTVAGNGSESGDLDAIGTSARIYSVGDLYCSGDQIYFIDRGNRKIRRFTLSTGQVLSLAGSGTNANADGVGSAASFSNPLGITGVGNDLYVADTSGHAIRKIDITDPTQAVVTTFAGMLGTAGWIDTNGTTAAFNTPYSLASDGKYLYVADSGNGVIRRINLQTRSVRNFLGNYPQTGHRDGHVSTALIAEGQTLNFIDGMLYIGSRGDDSIRRAK